MQIVLIMRFCFALTWSLFDWSILIREPVVVVKLGERRVPVHTRERAVSKKEIRRIPYPVYNNTPAIFWGGRFPVPAS